MGEGVAPPAAGVVRGESRIQKYLRGALIPLNGSAPAVVAGAALALSGVSTYWDIASHVDGGRERFLTPPHLGIYSGVTLALVVITLAMLGDRLTGGASLRAAIAHPFREVRPGLAAAATGMATALAAAPLDNAWHEIYGIDITIWSPPHLLAIFGVSGAAFGLAMLVAPAARHHHPLLHHFLLSAALGGLLVSAGEFEFNGPQYRIAYHPIILAATASLILVAASRGPHRWAATRVALWFEAMRLASIVLLVALDHSLPFVPLIVSTAVAADLLRHMLRTRPFLVGAALGVVTVATNAPLLELLGGITWRGDDLAFGTVGAAVASGIAAHVGINIGRALSGEGGMATRRRRRSAIGAALLVAALAALPTAAYAHEVGGDAGAGSMTWTPAAVSPGVPFTVRIDDLELASGADPDEVTLEAWRAEHRIDGRLVAEGDGYTGSLELPEEGPWMLLLRVRSGEDSLLTTQQIEVAAQPASSASRSHKERFTLGLDTLEASDPPAWLDTVAYGVSLVILLLLLRGLLRALRRLQNEHHGGREAVGPAAL